MSELEETQFKMSINGFEPANVYKFRIYFLTHKDAEENPGKEYGYVKKEYFGVTSGEYALDHERAYAVARSLAGLGDWNRGAYHDNYAFNTRGGWCDTYYGWTLKNLSKPIIPDDSANSQK